MESKKVLTQERKDGITSLLARTPFYRSIGIEVLSLEYGHAKITVKLKESFTNTQGIVQGGILQALIDSAAGVASLTTLSSEQRLRTIQNSTNFISNVDVLNNEKGALIGEGWVIHPGVRTHVSRAEIRDGKGKLLAAGVSTLMVIQSN